MFLSNLDIQSRARSGRVIKAILYASKLLDFDTCIIGTAYVTEKGARALVGLLRKSSPNWDNIQKKWLVSVDYGTSEPNALKFLMGIDNSQLRIYEGEKVLERNLMPLVAFHYKIYAFTSYKSKSISIISGSANLTGGGLYTNNEQVALHYISNPIEDSELNIYDNMKDTSEHLLSIFNSSIICTEEFISDYAEARKTRRNNSSVESDIEEKHYVGDIELNNSTEILSIATANNLWIQTGAVTPNRGARHGNQIDLQRGVGIFFGFSDILDQPVGWRANIDMIFDGEDYPRNIRIGNNGMEKLSLPAIDAPKYDGYGDKTILFTRLGSGSFQMYIGSSTDPEVWERKSLAEGEVYSLRSGRKYGVF